MSHVYDGLDTAVEPATTEIPRRPDDTFLQRLPSALPESAPRLPHAGRLAARRAQAAAPPHRPARLRLTIWTAGGLACLLVAHRLQPDNESVFAWPAGPSAWAALLLGLIGLWLVPSLWLSALLVRTGAGRAAWWGTRTATTLLWYAAVGPVIHHLGEGAQITTRGIVIATAAATAAATLGTVIGLARRPVSLWRRALLAAVVGALTAQAVIAVTMRVWTYDMNYAHIRRLDWLIVLACAALVTAAACSHPKMPPRLSAGGIRTGVVAAAVAAATVGALVITNVNWSPAQRMPSSFGIQQVQTPGGGDVAFLLTAIGPDGPAIIEGSDFAVTDAYGRPLPALTQTRGADGVADRTTLLVSLLPESRPLLCRADRPGKISVRDSEFGVRVQAPIPDGWCAR